MAGAVAFTEAGPFHELPVQDVLGKLTRMTRQTVDSFGDCF